MARPDLISQEYRKPPLTFGGWSFFDKARFRWGGFGDVVLGVAVIGSQHSAGGTVAGILLITLGITTWILTRFGVRGREDFGGQDWYSAWSSMPTAGRAIAGAGSVIGTVFLYVLFFYFFIFRLIWRYIVAPGLRGS